MIKELETIHKELEDTKLLSSKITDLIEEMEQKNKKDIKDIKDIKDFKYKPRMKLENEHRTSKL